MIASYPIFYLTDPTQVKLVRIQYISGLNKKNFSVYFHKLNFVFKTVDDQKFYNRSIYFQKRKVIVTQNI